MSGRRVKKGGNWRTLRVPDQEMDERVIPDVMNKVLLPQGRYPENFVLIYQLEGGVEKDGTWRTLRIPDQRCG